MLTRTTTLLRKLLKKPGIIVAPGAHNAFTAKIIEQTGGFKAVYMTGSGATMSLIGEPDIGLLTMTLLCGLSFLIIGLKRWSWQTRQGQDSGMQ